MTKFAEVEAMVEAAAAMQPLNKEDSLAAIQEVNQAFASQTYPATIKLQKTKTALVVTYRYAGSGCIERAVKYLSDLGLNGSASPARESPLSSGPRLDTLTLYLDPKFNFDQHNRVDSATKKTIAKLRRVKLSVGRTNQVNGVMHYYDDFRADLNALLDSYSASPKIRDKLLKSVDTLRRLTGA